MSAPRSQPHSQTRLYLLLAGSEGAEARLRSALSAATFDAVMITPASASQRDPAALKALVTLAQDHNAAALVSGDPALAKATHADGVHLPWSEDLDDKYDAARRALGARDIVGIDASGSRHIAMTLAEAGADYVAFSGTSHPAEGESAIEGQEALVHWWAEVFEIPCVALGVRTTEQAVALARSGADFVGIEAEAGLSADAIATRVRAIAAAIDSTAAPADAPPVPSSSRSKQ